MMVRTREPSKEFCTCETFHDKISLMKNDVQKTGTTKAAIYLRVSTEEQNESGLGLQSQEDRCRALILAKGFELTGIYRDGGVSGTIDPKDRPESGRLLQLSLIHI